MKNINKTFSMKFETLERLRVESFKKHLFQNKIIEIALKEYFDKNEIISQNENSNGN